MKIRSIPVGTTMPRANWGQENSKAADFIRNKPDLGGLKKTAEDAMKAAGNAKTAADNAKTAADNAQTAANNAQTAADNAQNTADNALPKAGGTMDGPIIMGGFQVAGVGDPSDGLDATNKNYVDSTFFSGTVVLTTAGWMGNNAPYAQTVNMAGILASDNPHYAVVYAGNQAQKLAQKEAFAMVDDLDTEDGVLTFTCFEAKPNVELTVQIEVNRQGIAAAAGAVMMMSLEEGVQSDVQMEIDGTTYGARNATINSEPTKNTYDFKVL